MQRVINFSGGRSSALMTIREYQPGDIVIFTDTGREHPKTYKFINDFEAHENIPVVRLRLGEGPEDAFTWLLAKKKYKVIPNRVKRFCTVELKIKVARRYMRSLGHTSYVNMIGFRSDEPSRVEKYKIFWKKVVSFFPLYSAGIDKQQVDAYWKSKPYDLEIPSILGNCTLCFMKGPYAIMHILATYPELAEPWIRDEELARELNGVDAKGRSRTYFPNITIKQLRDYAQNNLFKDYPLDIVKPESACFACTA